METSGVEVEGGFDGQGERRQASSDSCFPHGRGFQPDHTDLTD